MKSHQNWFDSVTLKMSAHAIAIISIFDECVLWNGNNAKCYKKHNKHNNVQFSPMLHCEMFLNWVCVCGDWLSVDIIIQ